jgi:hypothetical protein
MTEEALKALEELRQRIAAEGLPPLSADALRLSKLRPRPLPKTDRADTMPALSEEARRLYMQKSDAQWLWRKR